ncbi:hypothetical protein DUT91_23870 [Phyllobacterium salinisoli]|uniref:Uncharacterized protein n=1 Tax=Phyllobacterium salinisoli TaxID=1899321 RepID=A0A368JX02_9HYPH|nr:hypothetical protein DUT91_23870 [Phyllobacterium salinisoli]
MVTPIRIIPTGGEEDRRRIYRERKTLTAERMLHVNRIKGFTSFLDDGRQDLPDEQCCRASASGLCNVAFIIHPFFKCL